MNFKQFVLIAYHLGLQDKVEVTTGDMATVACEGGHQGAITTVDRIETGTLMSTNTPKPD
jgi:hypothetical protein